MWVWEGVNKGETLEKHGQMGRTSTILEVSRSRIEFGARRRFSPDFPGFPKLYGHLLHPPSMNTYASFCHCMQCPYPLAVKPAWVNLCSSNYPNALSFAGTTWGMIIERKKARPWPRSILLQGEERKAEGAGRAESAGEWWAGISASAPVASED